MLAIPAQREAGGRNRLDRAKAVPFDAGHLHQPLHRIAGHAKVVFKRDLGGVFHLFGRTAHHRAKPGSGHRRGRPDLGLAAAFRTGDRSVVLAQAADGGGGQKEIADLRGHRPRHMIQPVADHRRQDARRPVGGRGHDLPAGGVFLVHRHGIDTHPVVDRVRRGQVHPAFGQKRLVNTLGAAAHLQPAGQDAIGRKTTVDAIVHHLPEPLHPRLDLARGAEVQFVRALHLGYGLARSLRHLKHFRRVLEGIRAARGFRGDRVGPGAFGLGQDEAATDGIVGFLKDHVALRIGRHKDHAVGMAGQGRAVVEDQIVHRIEAQHRQAGRRHRSGLRNGGQRGFGLFVVVAFGDEPGQPQDRRTVGRVALAGKGKRSMQRRLQPRGMKGRGAQQFQKPRARHHRPHRVRGRRPHTHLEHVEDGKKHRRSFQVALPSGGRA